MKDLFNLHILYFLVINSTKALRVLKTSVIFQKKKKYKKLTAVIALTNNFDY